MSSYSLQKGSNIVPDYQQFWYYLSMATKAIAPGVVHTVPAELRKALTSSPKALAAWNGITPLARNEWICWITHVKKVETRQEHLKRAITELKEGKKRPCCWPGCPHRNENSKKWFKRLNMKI